MPVSRFLFQGVNERRNHADLVIELFAGAGNLNLPGMGTIDSGLISVAFLTEGGVDLIRAPLEAEAQKITAYVGVRNSVTTYQGVKALLDMGVRLFTVDTGAAHVIFHPKVYLALRDRAARVVTGSANLTRGGLGGNIEASIIADFDLDLAPDARFINELRSSFNELTVRFPQNVVEATPETLEAMLLDGRLLDETIERPPQTSTGRVLGGADNDASVRVPRMALTMPRLPPRRRVAVVQVAAPARAARAQAPVVAPPPPAPPLAADFALVWESGALTRRDLNIPAAQGTNPTGSMGLKRGQLPPDVDFQRYFRDDALAGLAWVPHPDQAGKEVATADISLVIRGINKGVFRVTITHDNRTNTTMYQQRNFMTAMSWGTAREHVAQENLIGSILRLYRSEAYPSRLLIEID